MTQHAREAKRSRSSPRLPPVVRRLGWASFANDVSSELVAALLPLYLVQLGTAGLGVGLIGGLEASTRSLLSVASGWSSDRLRRRKPFLLAGYALSAAAKTALGLTRSWGEILGLRVLDRAGKAVRTPPRDALIASAVGFEDRGHAFGFHRAMDTAGAVVGAAAAWIAATAWSAPDLRRLLLAGGLLGFLSLLPLLRLPRPVAAAGPEPAREEGPRLGLSLLAADLAALTLFAAGQISYLFFLIAVRGSYTDRWALGMPLAMYLLFQVVHALLATPFGRLSDRVGRTPVLVGGFLAFALAAAALPLATRILHHVAVFLLYGVAIAAVEGNQRAFVADRVPPEQRGLALGVLETAIGLAALAGNAAAGLLLDRFGSGAAFGFAASLALAAGALLGGRAAWRRS